MKCSVVGKGKGDIESSKKRNTAKREIYNVKLAKPKDVAPVMRLGVQFT